MNRIRVCQFVSMALFLMVASASNVANAQSFWLRNGGLPSWFTPSNWSQGAIPNSSRDAFVAQTDARILIAQDASARNMFIGSSFPFPSGQTNLYFDDAELSIAEDLIIGVSFGTPNLPFGTTDVFIRPRTARESSIDIGGDLLVERGSSLNLTNSFTNGQQPRIRSNGFILRGDLNIDGRYLLDVSGTSLIEPLTNVQVSEAGYFFSDSLRLQPGSTFEDLAGLGVGSFVISSPQRLHSSARHSLTATNATIRTPDFSVSNFAIADIVSSEIRTTGYAGVRGVFSVNGGTRSEANGRATNVIIEDSRLTANTILIERGHSGNNSPILTLFGNNSVTETLDHIVNKLDFLVRSASVSILDGAEVFTSSSEILRRSNVLVSGSGSRWDSASDLTLANKRNEVAELRISNSAVVETGHLDSSGNVIVENSATLNVTRSLDVGQIAGAGNLEVKSGATLNVDGEFEVATFLGESKVLHDRLFYDRNEIPPDDPIDPFGMDAISTASINSGSLHTGSAKIGSTRSDMAEIVHYGEGQLSLNDASWSNDTRIDVVNGALYSTDSNVTTDRLIVGESSFSDGEFSANALFRGGLLTAGVVQTRNSGVLRFSDDGIAIVDSVRLGEFNPFQSDDSQLIVEFGSQVFAKDANIQYGAAAFVSGDNSRLDFEDSVAVGLTDPSAPPTFSHLNIVNGGHVSVAAATGGFPRGSLLVGESGVLSVNATGSVTIGSDVRTEGFLSVGGDTLLLIQGLASAENFQTGLPGVAGRPEISIADGGTMNVANQANIGVATGDGGEVEVSGRLSVGGVSNIGLNESGVLSINGDGVFSSTDEVVVGRNAGSVGTIEVNGGTLETSATLSIGDGGLGSMIIHNAGMVSANTTEIGVRSGAVGVVNISGDDAIWHNADSILVGGSEGPSDATINIDGGLVTALNNLSVREGGNVNFSGGKLDVGVLDLSASTATENFYMTGGRLVADVIVGNFQMNGGVFAPGDSPGLSEIQGNLDMIAGSIEFEIGGLARIVEFDAIDVDGLAVLDGVIDVDLIDGFSAVMGDSFLLLDVAGGITGATTFDFGDAGLASGLSWDTANFHSDGIIRVVAAVPEPGTATLLVLAMTGLAIRRRRRVYS